MSLESIYLSQEERRRFLEIASEDTRARNTPEEDALLRDGLVKETMLAAIDLDTGYSTVDMHALVLSDLGREYFAQYMNQQVKNEQESFRHFQNLVIAVIGLAVSIFGAVISLLQTIE